MKTKLNGILTLLLALVVQVAFAQQTVTGKVMGPDGDSVIGAVVSIKGTSTFASTDFDGKYTIIASPESVLVFSYTGYDTQEITVGNQTVIDVKMSNNELETVVIQAYRNTTKETSNVASVTIGGDATIDRPNASIIQRLQGQIPGLTVQTTSGQPGANSNIQLRGPSSINGNTEPLILVDGVPVDEDVFRSFNPNDVESTTVLKDAAGTAIYGNRGANGVIIITTKSGGYDQPLKISYTGTTAFTELIENDYNLYDSRGYLRLERQQNVGLGATLTDAEINAFDIDTNWADTFYRTGLSQSHNISLSSGSKNLTQFTSVGYTKQSGSLVASDLQRFSIRNNITGKSDNGKFRFGTNLYLGYSQNNSQTEPENNRSNFIYFNSIFGANNGLPYLDPAAYDPDIFLPYFQGLAQSTYVLLDNITKNTNRDDETKIIVGANAEYDISNEFTIRYRVGMDLQNVVGIRNAPPDGALPRIRAFFGGFDLEGFQTETYLRDFRFNSTLNLGWKKKFGEGEESEKKHTVLANGYVEYVKGHLKQFGYTQNGLDPRTYAPGDGSGFLTDTGTDDNYVPTVFAGNNETGLFSYFGEFDYDYDTKYGFTGVIRRDASFRFTDDNAWGTFFSLASRWNVHREDFMKDVDFVDQLKVRLSYGETGNDRLGGGYYGALSNTRQLFATGNGYNDAQTFVRGGTIANPDLIWETVSTLNFGIDFGLFNNKLRGSIDVYNRETSDLFFNQFISGINGSYSTTANLGDMYNRGIELGLNYDLVRGQKAEDFYASVFANVAYNKNRVTFIDLPDGRQDNTGSGSVVEVGHQLNEFFVVPYRGVNPANGNLLFEDINGNLTEAPTNDDRRHTGKSTNPDLQGAFGANIGYKNFFFEAQFTYMAGISRFDSDYASYLDPTSVGTYQVTSDFERAWTPTNRVTDIPALNATNLSTGINNGRFLTDSDFVRLRFVQLGYNFPKSLTDNMFLTSGRFYVNAENLLTFSQWRGSDPERPSATASNRYPTPQTISVGLDLNF
jgi:TonB-linked SusC/RagA family outer membrane protein